MREHTDQVLFLKIIPPPNKQRLSEREGLVKRGLQMNAEMNLCTAAEANIDFVVNQHGHKEWRLPFSKQRVLQPSSHQPLQPPLMVYLRGTPAGEKQGHWPR